MTDAPQIVPDPPRRGLRPLILGGALALVGAAAGFGAIHFGVADRLPSALPGSGPTAPEIAFVELPPFVVSLPAGGSGRVLRFAATLEVEPSRRAEVELLMPRLLDVLNSYLRAVTAEEFASPGALIRLRAQMLRRVQVVAGEGRVRDLLVTEFVVN
ncbi:MAG: flagellar basal body-associated FliL family protein [Alkalilacustris sp.]